MCEFVSWIGYRGKFYFLTDDDLKSRRGKELAKYDSNKENWRGHVAICWFFKIERGKSQQFECEDFSSPENFPAEIVEAIKSGKMTMFYSQPKQLLT